MPHKSIVFSQHWYLSATLKTSKEINRNGFFDIQSVQITDTLVKAFENNQFCQFWALQTENISRILPLFQSLEHSETLVINESCKKKFRSQEIISKMKTSNEKIGTVVRKQNVKNQYLASFVGNILFNGKIMRTIKYSSVLISFNSLRNSWFSYPQLWRNSRLD